MPKPKSNPAAEFARQALSEIIDLKFYKGDGSAESIVIWLKAHAIKKHHQLSMLMGIERTSLRRCGMDNISQPKTGKQFRRLLKTAKE